MKKIVSFLLICTIVLLGETKVNEYTALEKSYLTGVYELNIEDVKQAINKGVNINLLSRHNQPILIYLLSGLPENSFKRIRIINYLIDKGIDINAMQNDSFSWTAIHYAINKSAYSVIDNLIKHKVHVNLKTLKVEEGEPPIFSIVSSEKPIEMLHYLLDKKIGNLKEIDSDGNTLLHAAVNSHIDLKLVKYLVDKISLESINKDGETILLTALCNSRNYSQYSTASLEDIIAFLLESGAKVNVASNSGNTALIMALKFTHSLKTINHLLEKGADANMASKNQHKPIVTASIRYDNREVLSLLVKHGAKLDDVIKESGSTLLHLSVVNRNKDNVAYLVENNVDINAKDNNGKTALNLALEGSYSDIIAILKSKGAVATNKEELLVYSKLQDEKNKAKELEKKQEVHDIYDAIRLDKNDAVKEYYENNSSLENKLINLAMFSVRKDNKESLEYFLQQGLNVKGLDKEKYNLLQQAVYHDKLEMIKFFLKKGLKINAHEKDTRSNFDLSCRCSVETFKYLMKIGMKAKKDEKKEIVTDAIYADNVKLAKYLLSQKYILNKELFKNSNFIMKIIKRGDVESLKLLLSEGMKSTQKIQPYSIPMEWSLLFTSMLYEQYEVSKFLLTKDVDIYEKVSGKGDLVEYMVRSGNVELLELYIQKGYDINYVDKKDVFSKTLLELAFEKKQAKIIKYLIENGAKLQINDKKENVLLSATILGYLDIVKILIEQKDADPYFIYDDYRYKNMSLKDIALQEGHDEVAKYLSGFDTEKLFLKKMKDKTISNKQYEYLFVSALQKNDMELVNKFKDDKDFNTILLNDFLKKIKTIKEPKEFDKAISLVVHYNIEYDKYEVLKGISDLKLFSYLVNKWNSKNFLKSKKAYVLLLDLISENKIEFIEFLFEKKASVVHVKEYYSLVTYALIHADNKMLKLLLKQKNIDIKEKDENGFSPLEVAIYHKNSELVKLLLPMKHGLSNKELLLSAVMSNNTEMFDYLCKELKVSKKELDKSKILLDAVKGSTIPMMENILSKGADINILDDNNRTILAYSIDRGYVVSKFLVEKGAKVDSEFNKYILHQIASKYSSSSSNVRKEKKEDDIKLIRFLAKHKLELNYKHRGYENVLSNLIDNKEDELILLLLELKVEVGESDISFALARKISKEIIHKLIDSYIFHYEENRAERWDPLILAVKYNDNNITKRLIDKGFSSIKYSSCDYTSPLILAVKKNNIELVDIMFDKIECYDKKAFIELKKIANKQASKQMIKLIEKKMSELDIKKVKKCVWNPYRGLNDKESEELDEKNYNIFLDKSVDSLLHIDIKKPYPKDKKEYRKFVKMAYKVAEEYKFQTKKDIFSFTFAWHVLGEDFLEIKEVSKILKSTMNNRTRAQKVFDYAMKKIDD